MRDRQTGERGQTVLVGNIASRIARIRTPSIPPHLKFGSVVGDRKFTARTQIRRFYYREISQTN